MITPSAPDERSELPWTGERYVPQVGGRIALEHLHRYAYAARHAQARDVLDIACGEGYGAHLLAKTARRVLGVDACPQAVAHAANKYRADNLAFCAGSCSAIPCADHSFDLVVSFETIEHHDQHEEMLREIKRVLRPSGLLLISTPDRRVYSEETGYTNPFHVKELSQPEFAALLKGHFAQVSMVGQRVTLASVIAPLAQVSPMARPPASVHFSSFHADGTQDHGGHNAASYLLAFASDGALPEKEADVDLFETSAVQESEAADALPALQARLEELERRLLAHAAADYPLGEEIDFRQQGNAWRYLHTGWDQATDGGTWTLAPQATLRLTLVGGWPENKELHLEIEAQGIVSREHPSTRLTLMLNGNPQGDHAFSGQESHGFALTRPAHGPNDGVLRLDLLIANPVSPLQIGLSDDPRNLGLLLTRMRITET